MVLPVIPPRRQPPEHEMIADAASARRRIGRWSNAEFAHCWTRHAFGHSRSRCMTSKPYWRAPENTGWVS